eukprot:TRINITY_DN10306_c0_g1_i3.p1 TRINITY_DN10306_c0_g1~~TRINITY_DN10306_c0_g1_i3.p1  ORF type:complete len:364 (+),score=58.96 TRINITY_DN10306_c0_g1_i3:44-1135(+)
MNQEDANSNSKQLARIASFFFGILASVVLISVINSLRDNSFDDDSQQNVTELRDLRPPPGPNGEKSPVIVVGTDRRFLPLFLNSILSLRRFGNYTILADCYDNTSCRFLKKAGFQVYEDSISFASGVEFYRISKCPVVKDVVAMRSYVMYARLELYKNLLEQDRDILMYDADTCWLRPPEVTFEDPRFDAIFACHLGKVHLPDFSKKMIEDSNLFVRINPGLAYIRPTKEIKESFFPRVLSDSLLHICDPGFAQGAVSRILERMGLVLKYFSEDNFLFGKVNQIKIKSIPFHLYRHGCEDDVMKPAKLSTAALIHPNCHNLPLDKIQTLKKDRCWFLSPGWEKVSPDGDLENYLKLISRRHKL